MFQGMQEFSTKINDMKTKMQEIIKAEGETRMKEMFKELFDKFPAIVQVSWRQYTPYFNDGEPCEFGVHDPQFTMQGEEADRYENCIWSLDSRVKDGKLKAPENWEEYKAAMQAVAKAVCGMDETMLATFGDHAEITVTPDKIVCESCDHD